MKKTLLILMISHFAFSQQSIEIRLVNPNVGSPIYSWPATFGSYTNDNGLNAIFSSYNVNHYTDNFSHPYPAYLQKIKIISGSFPQQFITDLLAYSSVIESAKITNGFEFTDAIRLQLINVSVGTPTGVNNTIIVTNDIGLNTIFTNYNVFYYTQSYSSALAGSALLRYYDVVCNCDKNLLKTALDNYLSAIQTTEKMAGGLFLTNPDFKASSTTIYPNPFKDTFTIETNKTISNYSLFDSSGKQIVTTNSKNELNSKSQKLSIGFYILCLKFENGQIINYKLEKK